jgi:hypothetical protein
MSTRFALVLSGLMALAPVFAAPPSEASPPGAKPSEVMVVGTLHRFHAKSTTYTYDMLYALVDAARPDYVGVEIRAEDMGRDPAYLAANYPKEMIETAAKWGPKAFGFDWLGDDVAGRAVPPDWWRVQSPIKALEREGSADPAVQSKDLDGLDAQKMAFIETATAASLNDGRYDGLNAAYYALNAKLLAGTKYQPIADFYAARDAHIDANIAAFITAHPGKRIVILTGGDHHGPLVAYLKEKLGPAVKLIAVP